MYAITTIAELQSIICWYKPDDPVVIEIHDMEATEDLYGFYVDPIDLGDGRTEIRLTVLSHDQFEDTRNP